MGFRQIGNVLVPDTYQRPDRAIGADRGLQDIYDSVLGEMQKSIFHGRPKATPRVMLPWNYTTGLYGGVKTPAHASMKTHEFLRRMGGYFAPRMVISTLTDQMTRFGRPARTQSEQGFEVYVRDESARPTKGDKRRIAALVDLIMRGGVITQRNEDGALGVWSGDQTEEADPFPVLLQKLAKDGLELAWATFRIESGINARQTPVAFMKMLDSARIRFTEQQPRQPVLNELGEPLDIGYKPRVRHGTRVEYVELGDHGQPINEYTWHEVIPWVRNQRSDLLAQGYGWPELASALELVVGMVKAVEHNIRYFTHNRIPPGIVSTSGDFDESLLQDFLWNITQPGSDGDMHYRLPMMMGGKDFKLQYTPFRQTDKQDMFWRNWIVFLLSALASLYNVAMEEMNFQAFLTVGGLQSGTGGEQRVATLRSTGFRNNMTSLEAVFDRRIVAPFWADSTGIGPYGFRWVNLVPRDEERERQAQVQDLNAGILSINEVRALRDQREIRDPVDRELYLRLWDELRAHNPKLYHHRDEFLDVLERRYEKRGGKWALWPEAPMSPSALQVYQQEHQGDLGPDVPEQEQVAPGAGDEQQQGTDPAAMQAQFQQFQQQAAGGQRPAPKQASTGPDDRDEPQAAEDGVRKSVLASHLRRLGAAERAQKPSLGQRVLRVVLRPAQALKGWLSRGRR